MTAPALRQAVEPLAEARRRGGYEVTVLETTSLATEPQLRGGDASRIRDAIRAHCAAPPGGPTTTRSATVDCVVLLVGAVQTDAAADWRAVVPPLRGTIARMADQPSDNGYGCSGAEVVPSIAVGRMPARKADEAAAMVRKTLAAEQPAPGESKRRLLLLAGSPSYNPALDQTVERLVLAGFERVDPAWSGRVIYDNSASTYTLPDADLAPRARAFLADGPAVCVYLGHSSAEGFWYRPGRPPLFSRDDWRDVATRPGLLATFGCNGAQLTGPDGEGYGVWAIRNPQGPAAVIGSHGVCWAAMSLLMAQGLLEALPAADGAPRLAELWLGMKERLANEPLNPVLFAALDAVDGDPGTPQDVQRREHQEMFVLLGDPALRLPRFAHALRPQVSRAAGGRLRVTLRAPAEMEGASGRVTLERTLTSRRGDLTALPPDDPRGAAEATTRANHAKANDFVLSAADVRLDGRELRVELPAPADWPPELTLARVYLRRGDVEAFGVARLDD